MARIHPSPSFELNSVTNAVEVDTFFGSPATDATAARSGDFGLHISSLASGTAKGYRHAFALSTNNGPNWIRHYFKFPTFPSAENRIFLLNDAATLNTPAIYVTIDSGGVLRLYDEDGQITGTTTVSTGVWFNLEVYFDRTPAAGSQVVEARVDEGAAFASSSTRDLATNIWVSAAGMNLNNEAQTTGECYIDDIAFNTNVGSFQNSWPGQGEIIRMLPNAAGDNSAWTGTNADIDEVTPDDATTLISEGPTANATEDVNLTATPAAMASDDVINVVSLGMRYNLSATTGSDPRAVMRIMANTGGTVEESSAFVINATTWVSNFIGNAHPTLVLYDLPGASTTAWTKADLDTAQIGVRISTTDSDLFQVTSLWLLVDHKPNPSAPADQIWPEHTVIDETYYEEHDYSGFVAWQMPSDVVAFDESIRQECPVVDEIYHEVYNYSGMTQSPMRADVFAIAPQELPQIDETYDQEHDYNGFVTWQVPADVVVVEDQPLMAELPSIDETFDVEHDYAGFAAWQMPDNVEDFQPLPETTPIDETYYEEHDYQGYLNWQMPANVEDFQALPELPVIDETYYDEYDYYGMTLAPLADDVVPQVTPSFFELPVIDEAYYPLGHSYAGWVQSPLPASVEPPTPAVYPVIDELYDLFYGHSFDGLVSYPIGNRPDVLVQLLSHLVGVQIPVGGDVLLKPTTGKVRVIKTPTADVKTDDVLTLGE